MHEGKHHTSASFTTGIIAGVVLGAGVALLFAPKAGQRLREQIGESADSLREAVARRYRNLADRAGVEIEDLHAKVDEAAESVEAAARDIVDSASELAGTTARRARRART